MNTFIGIIFGLLLLGLMMFLHEFGHYYMGKKLGFKILEFNIFMGPVLFSWMKNGVLFTLRLVPIGASVRFAGEEQDELDARPKKKSESITGKNSEISESSDLTADKRNKISSNWGKVNSKAVADQNDPRLFNNRPIRFRALTLAAGPLMNIISGIVVLFFIFFFKGFEVPTVSSVDEGSPAERAGIVSGSEIIRINGISISNPLDQRYITLFTPPSAELRLEYKDKNGTIRNTLLSPKKVNQKMLGIARNPEEKIVRVLSVSPNSNRGNPVLKTNDIIKSINGSPVDSKNISSVLNESESGIAKLKVLRDGKEMDLESSLSESEYYESPGFYWTEKKGISGLGSYTLKYFFSFIKVTFGSIGKIFTGELNAKDALGGPVSIVNVVSKVVTADADLLNKIVSMGMLFASVSFSLGIVNLLPIPLLDGSHLLLLIIEKIRGKRLSERAQLIFAVAGLILILGLFVLGLYFDISRIVSHG